MHGAILLKKTKVWFPFAVWFKCSEQQLCFVYEVVNPFWDDPWAKNRHIGETDPVLEKLVIWF